MDVSYTNVLEVSRQYFQGLPVPSTAGSATLTENVTTSTSTSFDNGTSTTYSSITTPVLATTPANSNISANQRYSETKPEETGSSSSYWNPPGPNELRPIEPYPPQLTRVEVPDTRPEESAMEPGHGSTTLTEMQPSKQRTTEQKQEPSSTVPASEHPTLSPQLHQMQPPNSHSPAPVYQQLNSVSRTPYSSSESLASHTTYQGERSSPSSSIVAQRVQYYPRYHHPDIRKSAPVPFSQSSMYQPNNVPPSASPSGTVPMRPTSAEQVNPLSVPPSSHPQQDQQRVPTAYLPAQSLVGGSSVYGTSPQNHHPSSYLGAQSRIGSSNLTGLGVQHSDGHSSSSSSSSVNPCSPRLGSSSTAAGSSSHIPSPHNMPAHIPSPHLPSGSSSASTSLPHQHPSRNVPSSHTISNTYPGRTVLSSAGNQQIGHPQSSAGYYPIPSPHELGQHTSPAPQRQSPHVSLHNPHASPHHTSSPHSNYHQPHSPPYPPPPSRSTPQSYSSVPPTSQQYQVAPSFANPYHSTPQSLYHPFQKNPQPQHSSYYPQPGRPHYPQHMGPAQTSLACSTPGSNGAVYQSSQTKPVTYNGADVKKSPADVTTYGSYRPPPAPIQRPANTHNLPPIGALSFPNRNSREPLAKSQPVPRQRTHSMSSVSKASLAPPPAPTMAAPRRVADYPVAPAPTSHPPTSHALPINGRTTTVPSSSYSRYNQQGAYPPYATTVAPSHYGSNSSRSTTVTWVDMPSRPTVPTQANHQYPTSDSSRPTAPYLGVARAPENYGFNGYYPNSSTSSTSPSTAQAAAPPPLPPQPQSNGLPVRKRESPLDLSVKTVKTSADSTAQDDEAGNMDRHVSSSNSVSSRSGSGSRNMLPPAQPPPASLFPFDARSVNGARSSSVSSVRASTPLTVCAPKVEFYPDFNPAPLRHQTQSRENSLRRSSSQQLYASRQPSTIPLPHMSTFKKSSLPSTPLYDGKSMPPSSYHPNDPTLARTSRYTSVLDPGRSAHALTHQETSNPSKYYLDSRSKFTPPASQSTEKLPMKRPTEATYSGGTPNKQPKVDTWRMAIDEQIQQKLSSARALLEQQKRQEINLPPPLPNGSMAAPGAYNQRSDITYPSESTRYQAYCDKKSYQDLNVPRSLPSYPQPISKPSNVHSMPQPSGSQMSYLGYRPGQRMPYSSSTGQPGGQPSNTGADKRVLSLLRNSLENKQQREEQLNSQQPNLVNHSQQSFQNKVVTPIEPKMNIGRHNLSPFTAASMLERNSNTPPHYKFHVPKAVDSITQDGSRGMYASRMNLSATLPGKDSLLNPRGIDNQMLREKDDGLAAKFRTKGELKQVGTGQFASKPPALLAQDTTAIPKDLEGAASTSTPQTPGSSAGSPPKLTREKLASLPPRRRLFSRTDEENMPTSATVPAPAIASTVSPRASGFRSSSETSVFDFRESDSEGEMPVLERQTLEEMRRDRKQLSKVQPPIPLNDAMCMGMTSSADLVKIELKENDKITEIDPFWAATCDKFMEQLRNGDSVKKRGRKKKTETAPALKIEVDLEPRIEEFESETLQHDTLQTVIRPEDIKKEIPDVEPTSRETPLKEEEPGKEVIPPEVKTELITEVLVKEENNETGDDKEKVKSKEKNKGKNSGEDSDELPLIKRAKKKKSKKDDSDGEDEIVCRKNRVRRGSRIKLESSSGSESSSEESDASTEFGQSSSVADRLRARKRTGKEKVDSEGMKLRSRGNTPHKVKQQEKGTKSQKGTPNKSKPKPHFGDGSDFRPGWEEEVYVYKKSLRMPSRLITVSKPARFHRLSTSLPDLDPGSPALSVSMDSVDVCLNRKRVDSDAESNCSFSIAGLGTKVEDEEATSSTIVSCPPKSTRFSRSDNNSIVDVLAQKVGTSKKDARKTKEKVDKSPAKILRRSNNEPELLPTPSLTPFVTLEPAKVKGKTPVKNNKSQKPIKVSDSLLGYFRKETINNFRDTFKNNHALPNEFSTVVLKSRTRTETRVLKKQATIREVFGEDRPASAPPMRNHGDTSQDDDSQNESQSGVVQSSLTSKRKVVSRWRNAGLLRSNKAIINSKRHLLIAKRRKDIIESRADTKLKHPKEIKKEIEDEDDEDDDDEEEEEQVQDEAQEVEVNEPEADNNDDAELPSKKKFRTGRRKFRSGFDYIRKKKKPLKKDEAFPKERKRQTMPKPNPECEADIQTEIRTWVIKKGVGETILHRAARLGYTDVAAYCLEKLNNVPSPKDNAGYTPLHEACAKGHLEIAKLLLAYGANVSESANGGIRPLHEACENGATELVRLLLSYGADPLLATYAGHTPLMLAVETEAYTILEQHLSDIQGRTCQPWSFGGPSSIFDPEESGYNPLEDPPAESPKVELEEIEMEVSDVNLPVLFTLNNDPDKWILLQDLMTALKMKSRDALLRQVNPKAVTGPPAIAHRDVLKELKLADFLDQSRCCHLLSAGEKINVRGSKVSLIKYNDKVKSLLNVERVIIDMR